MSRRAQLAILLAVLVLLAIFALRPDPTRSDQPAASGVVPAQEFTVISPLNMTRATTFISKSIQPVAGTPRPIEKPVPSPSLRAVPRLAAVVATPSRRDTSTTGIASTYGPGFDGYLALPAGPGIHVRICGAGGCIDRVSNDKGPVASLHRVADLSVADFEFVSGLPWTRGLCRVSVEVLP